MKIGIFGTGIVGQTLSGKLSSLGHDVVIGTRDPAATLARTEKDALGFPAFRDWHATHAAVKLVTLAEAASHAELAVNVLNGASAVEGLRAHEEALAGKVLVDVTNPLDFSKGFPPSLLVGNTDSLGEQIQRALPRSKVVKTLNTVNAFLMVDPKSLAGGEHTMFLAGNDADAKATVGGLLREGFGWTDLVDLGDLSNARATEAYVTLWARLYGALGVPQFNVRVVR